MDMTLTGTTTSVRVVLGVMVVKGYSSFPKAHHLMQFIVISRTLVGVGSYCFAEIQPAYSTAPANTTDYLYIMH